MKLGFIVNPIAGMGGKVGLKGTNGVVKKATAMGAKPIANQRARDFLLALKRKMGENKLQFVVCPGIMGEKAVKTVNFPVQILPIEIGKKTSAEDTKIAVKFLIQLKVDIIVFVGGDGTAKDVYDAMTTKRLPVLGIPAGVKMYSGIFAVNPSDAAEVIMAFSQKQSEIMDFEIVDADEKMIRKNVFAVKLYGFLQGPFVPARIQRSKQVSLDTGDEKGNQIAIAKFIIEEMTPDATYILGPGTTVKRIAENLGVEKTLLGVDLYRNGEIILDVNEKRILDEIKDWQTTWIILSPIGRQGILFGRGNQQISSEIIKRVGKQRLIVAATKNKLHSIVGNIIRVDTGDENLDSSLKGYIKIYTDYREWRLLRIQ